MPCQPSGLPILITGRKPTGWPGWFVAGCSAGSLTGPLGTQLRAEGAVRRAGEAGMPISY
ncbi:MAG: hypothetical protein ACFCU6_04815 [Balneolaceae bacterium]